MRIQLRIQLLSSEILIMEFFFFVCFSYNLSAGTLSSVVINVFAKFGVKMLFCKQYFSPLNTFMRKGKDPDPDQYRTSD